MGLLLAGAVAGWWGWSLALTRGPSARDSAAAVTAPVAIDPGMVVDEGKPNEMDPMPVEAEDVPIDPPREWQGGAFRPIVNRDGRPSPWVRALLNEAEWARFERWYDTAREAVARFDMQHMEMSTEADGTLVMEVKAAPEDAARLYDRLRSSLATVIDPDLAESFERNFDPGMYDQLFSVGLHRKTVRVQPVVGPEGETRYLAEMKIVAYYVMPPDWPSESFEAEIFSIRFNDPHPWADLGNIADFLPLVIPRPNGD